MPPGRKLRRLPPDLVNERGEALLPGMLPDETLNIVEEDEPMEELGPVGPEEDDEEPEEE